MMIMISDVPEPEAYELLKLCIREIQKRLLLNLPSFKVKMVSKHGVTTLPNIDAAMLHKASTSNSATRS